MLFGLQLRHAISVLAHGQEFICRYVMDDAREDALVLLDELGKGTEVAAGTALAAAFLERLAGARCRGIFAT